MHARLAARQLTAKDLVRSYGAGYVTLPTIPSQTPSGYRPRGWQGPPPPRIRAGLPRCPGLGWIVNRKKVQRLRREEGLRVPQRRRHKHHGTSTAPPTVVADAPNRVWAVDFQFDSTTDGRPIKIVAVIDEHTRECLGGMVERSITGEHLIDELDRLAVQRGSHTPDRPSTRIVSRPRSAHTLISDSSRRRT